MNRFIRLMACLGSTGVLNAGEAADHRIPTELRTMEEYRALAMPDERMRGLDLMEVKFVITGLDGDTPKMNFMDPRRNPVHFEFIKTQLGIDPVEFLAGGSPKAMRRKYFGGNLVFWPNALHPAGEKGVMVLECMGPPTIEPQAASVIFRRVQAATGDLGRRLAYRLSARSIEGKPAEEVKAEFAKLGVPLLFDENLISNSTYTALNRGKAIGYLRVAEGATSLGFGDRDIVIFPRMPSDVGRLGATITEEPQTPLCHVNLRARQNRTPNIYLKNARSDKRLKDFVDKLVQVEVEGQSFTVTAVDERTADAWFQDRQGKRAVQKLKLDAGPKELRRLSSLEFGDAKAYGAKAANVGELLRLMPGNAPEDGFGVPFSWYLEFMKFAQLDEAAGKLVEMCTAEPNAERREGLLKEFRKKIKEARAPAWMEEALEIERKRFSAETPLRCRSSTNSEDLVGFSGAGLYESYTHRPDEGKLLKTVKQVWASLWLKRAFDERQYHKIDHLSAAMAVLVHPNFDDEKVNGVAVAKNLFIPHAPGFSVNVQVGEDLVTNPEEGSLSEELQLVVRPQARVCETTVMRRSNRVPAGVRVMADERAADLAVKLAAVQEHFLKLYHPEMKPAGARPRVASSVNERFSIEVEFKITKEGRLVIKQARPWVD